MLNEAFIATAEALTKLGVIVKNPTEMIPIDKWVQSSGKIWTTERLKNLKVVAIELINGRREPNLPSWTKYQWYKGRKIPSYPIFRYLLIAIDADNYKAVRLCLSILNLYHLFRGVHPKKVMDSVLNLSTPFSDKELEAQKAYLPFVEAFVGDLRARYHDKGIEPSPFSSSVAIKPGLNGRYEGVISKPRFPTIIKNRIHKVVPPSGLELWSYSQSEIDDNWGGNIHVIPESGMKQRIIVIPNLWLQWALKPLKDQLLSMLKGLMEDGTHDQEEAVRFLKRSFGKRSFHAVDLSSATDNFSQIWQRRFLQLIGVPHDLLGAMFDLYYTYKGEDYRYVKGQAMGLGPSFPLFALVHHAILRGLCNHLGLSPRANYRILGDDIVILDDVLAREYKIVLHDCGIPISVKKSISGNLLTEFAGKILWKGRDVTPIKWRSISKANIEISYQYFAIGLNPHKLFPSLTSYIKAFELIPKGLGGMLKEKFSVPTDKFIRGLVTHKVASLRKILTYVSGKVKLSESDLFKTDPIWWDGSAVSLRILQELAYNPTSKDPRLTPLVNLAYLSPDPVRTLNELLDVHDWDDVFQFPSSPKEIKIYWRSQSCTPQDTLRVVSEAFARISNLRNKELSMSKDKKSRASKEFIVNADVFNMTPGIYKYSDLVRKVKDRQRKSEEASVGLFSYVLDDDPAETALEQISKQIINETYIRLVVKDKVASASQ